MSLIQKESREELEAANERASQRTNAALKGDYSNFDVSVVHAIQHGYEVPSKLVLSNSLFESLI
jgi:2-succinyl-5-enolpyruvyl-6-hydroxy-3-cyclohexene-1-carboxylate synthase